MSLAGDDPVLIAPEPHRTTSPAAIAKRENRRSGALMDRVVGPIEAQTEAEVTVTVGGGVDFSLLQIVAPGDEFTITVRATARP
jgi:hypothetical protein